MHVELLTCFDFRMKGPKIILDILNHLGKFQLWAVVKINIIMSK